MNNQDVRWKQRFENYKLALIQLKKFVEKGNELNELEEQGLIKAFEYTYELAWNTLKDFYENQGESGIQGSRDAIQMAFKRGLINNGEEWMKMLLDRNRTSHSYNEKIADEISKSILENYYSNFVKLESDLNKILSE